MEPRDAAAHTSIAGLVPAHTRVFHDKFDTRLKPKRYDEARTLLFGWKEAHRAGSVAFASSGLYGARGRILLPAWRSPHPTSAGSPLRPPSSQVRRQRRSPRTRGPLLLSPGFSKSTRPATGPSSNGTRRKSGSQSDSEAVAQNDARMPFTAGSLPYPLV